MLFPLDSLDDGRDTHAAADAQRDQRTAGVTPFELVDHGSGDHGAGSAQRVAHGDGSAVDVQLLVGDVQVLLELQHHRCERLVELEQVDVVNGQAGAVQHLTSGRGGPGQHDDRIGATGGGGHDACPRSQALRLAGGLGTDQHQCGAVDDAGAVAAGVHVIDLLDVVVLLQRHVIEPAHCADSVERGLELAQTFQRGVGAHVLVVVEDDKTVLVLHRHYRLGEVAARPRGSGLLLRPQSIGVDIVAGEALDGGDQVSADALRHEADAVVGLGVGRPGAAVGAHRDTAHRLDAASQNQVVPTRAHLLRGGVYGLEARGAETVELEPAGGLGQLGYQCGSAGDVAALVTDGRHDAEDDIADQVRGEIGKASAQLVDQANDQVYGLDRLQRPGARFASRCTYGLVDEGFFGHVDFLFAKGGVRICLKD